MVDDDILSPDCLELYKPLPIDSSGQAELKRLAIEKEIKLRQLELEIQRDLEAQKLEAHNRQLEARKYERELDHERELKALELRAQEFEFRKAHEESMASKFDLSKNVRLVPPFNEGRN